MRLLPTALAAAALTLMAVPSFAMDKMDGDAVLKMIFKGKPADWAAMMKMPMMDMPMMKMPMAPKMMAPPMAKPKAKMAMKY